MPGWVPRAILLFFLGLGGFFVARWLFAELQSVLLTLVVSLFLSFAMEPAVNWLAARGWRRGTATWLVFLGLIVATTGFVVSIGTVLVRQLANLAERAPQYLEQIEEWADERFGVDLATDELVARLTEAEGPLRDLAADVAANLLGYTAAFVGGAFQVLTIALFTWYLVADGPRLRRSLLSTQPAHRQSQVLRAWELAIDKTGGYIYSRALLAIAAGLATWVALAIIGVPYAVPLALWVGAVSQFVPAIGAFLGGAAPLLVALVHDPPLAVFVLGFIIAYQQVENYLLAPRVTAHTMALHPAVAFGTVLVGVALVGPIGAVLALPLAAILQAFASAFITRHEVMESGLTAEPARRARPRAWRRSGDWRRSTRPTT